MADAEKTSGRRATVDLMGPLRRSLGMPEPPEMLPIRIRRDEGAYLLNVLSDNAKPWNARLRRELSNLVSDIQAYNAQRELQGRRD